MLPALAEFKSPRLAAQTLGYVFQREQHDGKPSEANKKLLLETKPHWLRLLAMKDGSDAISDWPLLNALLNTAGGATWVSLHHGGGVGMGYSQHAGMVIVADGSEDAARRLKRVLWNDPGTGVMRHADAGYEEAIACAREQGLDLPMLP